MKRFDHRLDIFPVELHLITGRKAWRKFWRSIDTMRELPGSAGMTVTVLDRKTGWLHVVIWIDTSWHGHAKSCRSTAVHEAVHAACSILDHFGQKYDGESETLAYLADWLADWITAATDS